MYLCIRIKTKALGNAENHLLLIQYIREYMQKASFYKLAFLFSIDFIIVIFGIILFVDVSQRQLAIDGSIERNNGFAAR